MTQTAQPRTLYILFFTEMWERFSFYGIRALLVLFLIDQYSYTNVDAVSTFGAYMSLVYITPVIGGLISDKLLGAKKAIVLGAVLMIMGQILLVFETQPIFFSGLGLIITGTGFIKSNVSALVGSLYRPKDPRRDGGFTIFYMGINIGAFLASAICGLVADKFGWHYAFSLGAAGMLIGLLTFIRNLKKLKKHGNPPNPSLLTKKGLLGINRQHLIIFATFVVSPFFGYLLTHTHITNLLLIIIAVIALGCILGLAFSSPKAQRNKLLGLLILMILYLVFNSLFEQAGTSITLFTKHFVDRYLFSFQIPAATFLSFNPFFILILSPFFVKLWTHLNKKENKPSTPLKFSVGILFAGLGFITLALGGTFLSNTGQVNMNWIILTYLLHTIGELSLAPIGLSAVTRLSPPKWVGALMGAWYLSMAFAENLGALMAKVTAASQGQADSLKVYTHLFTNIGELAIIIAILTFFASPYIKRLTQSK